MVRKIRSAFAITGAPARPEDLKKYFNGELMTCVMCGRQQLSDPNVNLEWRVLEGDGVPYYACPNEFPPDTAGPGDFDAAYRKVLAEIQRRRAI